MTRYDLMLKLGRTLLRRRSALERSFATHAAMIGTAGDRPVGDSIDAAVDGEQGELDSQLAVLESRELSAIDAALDRIRRCRYGICEDCQRSIPAARLQAVPYATLCIGCQRKHERRGVPPSLTPHWEIVADDPSEEEPKAIESLELELAL